MNDIMKIIKDRRSIRSYEERAVPDEAISRILDAARWAPSALNHQPLRYIVITERNLIENLSKRTKTCARRITRWLPLFRLFARELHDELLVKRIRERAASTSGDPIFYRAPLLVLVLADKKAFQAYTDLGFAAQNMMLEATAMGLGSCAIGFATLLNMDREVGKLLGVPAGHRILAGVIFGYPKTHPQAPERKKNYLINRIGK